MRWIVVSSAVGVALAGFVPYLHNRGTNRYGFVAMALPLVPVPALAGAMIGVIQLIQGFRSLALSGEGGVHSVASIIIEANRLAFWGHGASLVVALVLVALGAGLANRVDAPADSASPLRSFVVIAFAVIPLIPAAIVSELAARSIAYPLPVVVPVEHANDTQAPHMLRARKALDLDTTNDVGAVANRLSSSYVLSIVAAVATSHRS